MCLLGTTVNENLVNAQVGQLVVVDPDYPQRTCKPKISVHQELPFDDVCKVRFRHGFHKRGAWLWHASVLKSILSPIF